MTDSITYTIRTTSDTIETLNNRVSVRSYRPEPIDDATLNTLLNAARRTATSSNTQTYSIIVVRDPQKRERLAELAGNQRHIVECGVFVALCADLARMEQAARMHGETLAVNLELSMIAIVDAAIVGQSLSLAAESLGLGTVMIGAMRNQPQAVAQLLGLPRGVFVVYGLCIGHIAEKPPQKPRLPEDTVIHYETYTPASDDRLREHDAELAAHYEATGRNANPAAWTGFNAKKFNVRQRDRNRAILEEMGFRFD